MADSTYTVTKPQDWDKAVFAAYLILIGESQARAAKIAGVGQRTVERWVVSDFWPDACEEAAKDRWLKHLAHRARVSVMKNLDDDGHLALKVAERLDPHLAPPSQRLEHSGPGGGPIEYLEMDDDELIRHARQTANRVAALSTNGSNGKR